MIGQSVQEWINGHLRQDSKAAEFDPYSLHINPLAVLDKWKNAPEAFIRAVEDVCGVLVDVLSYEKWTS